MERDSFVFYRSFYEAIVELPREIQGEVLTAVIEYGLYGETTESLKPIAKAMMALIKPQMDANNKKYENGCKGAEFGKLGGRPRKEETPKKPLENPTETPNVNVNDNVNDIKETISKEIVKKSATKVATLTERQNIFYDSLISFVGAYSKDMIREFYDYWSEPNQTKSKMRFEMERTWDTSRRLSTWAKRDNQIKAKQNGNNSKSYQQQERDFKQSQYAKFEQSIVNRLSQHFNEV